MLPKTRLFRQFPFRDGVTRMDTALETDRYTQKNMYAAYTNATGLHLARLPFQELMEKNPEWEDLGLIAPGAVDCAVAFDGFWRRENTTKRFYFHATTLWLFWVTEHAEMKTAIWKDGVIQNVETLVPSVPTGVSSLSAIRGWKSMTAGHKDQGLIIAYTYQGEVRYRARTEQENGTIMWESEQLLEEAPFPAQKVRLFRGNDYRTGFMVESDGQMHSIISRREWIGDTSPSHIIKSTIADLHIEMLPVDYIDTQTKHTVSATLTDLFMDVLYGLSYYEFISCHNQGSTTLHVETRWFLRDIAINEWMITDTLNQTFSILAVEHDYRSKTFKLTTDDLAYSMEGPLTLKFLGSGLTNGEAGQNVDPFEITFTPEGIDYLFVPAPTVVNIYND